MRKCDLKGSARCREEQLLLSLPVSDTYVRVLCASADVADSAESSANPTAMIMVVCFTKAPKSAQVARWRKSILERKGGAR